MKQQFALAMAMWICGSVLRAQMPSPFIQVDQFGYFPGAEKVAVISDPQVGFNQDLSYTPGMMLQLRDALTDAVVFTAPPVAWNGGATHTQSGDRGWWFDFSSVSQPGSYVVVDPNTNARSARFDINANVYDGVLYHALRMYYYNRANEAKATPYAQSNWTDAAAFLGPNQDANAAFVGDPNNANLRRDLSGGWFDAGDQNKYVTFAELPIHELLSAYEENPQAFQQSSNIPESANALPDVLDEVKVELDWILKMSSADGRVILKMGNSGFTANQNTPPSSNGDPRFYSSTCTSASLATAGMFAHAALVFRDQPAMSAYAELLASRAEACYAFAEPYLAAGTLQTACDNGEIRAGDADRSAEEQVYSAIVAAIYLREYRDTTIYDALLSAEIPNTPPLRDFTYFSEQSYVNDALLRYIASPGADAQLVFLLNRNLGFTIDAQPWYGWSERDLYRAELPDAYYGWASNSSKARFGYWNLQLARLGRQRTDGADLARRGRETLHYLHGVNPLGLVMVSNMYGAGAERSVNEIYHGWFFHNSAWENALTSTYGPAPGFLTGGPNFYYTEISAHDPTLIPPVGQPAMKSYLDDNNPYKADGSDNAIYALNEPGIYYNSALVRYLAYFVGNAAPLPVQLLDFMATPNGDDVQIHWRAATETNLREYHVQRAEDAQTFITIATKAGGATDFSYTCVDRASRTSTVYYRLEMLDVDGELSYSAIVAVEQLTNVPPSAFGALQIFPNPATNQLFLQIEQPETLQQLRLIDLTGRERFRKTSLSREQQQIIDISSLPAGIYLLELSSAKEKRTLPVTIQY